MKNMLLLGSFAAGFAGAVGVGATTVNMKGSDTLYDLTTVVIASCPGTFPGYAGTGSTIGFNAMRATSPTQFVAPMTTFIDGATCGAVVGAPAGPQTDGLVIGLDSLALVGSNLTFADSTSCTGLPNPTCDPAF